MLRILRNFGLNESGFFEPRVYAINGYRAKPLNENQDRSPFAMNGESIHLGNPSDPGGSVRELSGSSGQWLC